MIRKIVIVCNLLFFMVFSGGVLADTQKNLPNNKTEKAFTAPQTIKVAAKVKELRSKRGVRFFYMQDRSAHLIHVKIAFKNAGSAHQKKSEVGVPLLFTKAVFQGAGKYSSAELKKALSDIASSISCTCNVDRLEFSLTTPTIVLEKAAILLNTILTNPKFEEDKIKILQDSLVGTLQNYAINPVEIASYKFIPSIIFKSHPYENGEFGAAEDFVKLSVNELKKYKDKSIVVGNAQACVFGDISEAKAIQLIDRIFEKVKGGNSARNRIANIEPQLTPVKQKYYAQGPQSTVAFVLKYARPESSYAHAAAIVSTMLGNPPLFKTRIMGILRSKLGYIYGGRIIVVHQDHASYMLGIFKTDNMKVDKAISALKNIVRDLREKGITEDELKFAKGYIKGSSLVQLRTSGKLCDFYFREMMKGNGINALNEKLEEVNNVTLDEVKEFCRENLDENNIPFVVIGGNAQ